MYCVPANANIFWEACIRSNELRSHIVGNQFDANIIRALFERVFSCAHCDLILYQKRMMNFMPKYNACH